MIIKVFRADGEVELFHTDKYRISRPENLHLLVLKVIVYAESGKKLFKICRKNRFLYKHITFKTAAVQDALKKMVEVEDEEM